LPTLYHVEVELLERVPTPRTKRTCCVPVRRRRPAG
jgi:hypothetical protein